MGKILLEPRPLKKCLVTIVLCLFLLVDVITTFIMLSKSMFLYWWPFKVTVFSQHKYFILLYIFFFQGSSYISRALKSEIHFFASDKWTVTCFWNRVPIKQRWHPLGRILQGGYVLQKLSVWNWDEWECYRTTLSAYYRLWLIRCKERAKSHHHCALEEALNLRFLHGNCPYNKIMPSFCWNISQAVHLEITKDHILSLDKIC